MIVDAIESWPGLIVLTAIFAAGFFYTVPADKKAFKARDFSHTTHSLLWFFLWAVAALIWGWVYHSPAVRTPF